MGATAASVLAPTAACSPRAAQPADPTCVRLPIPPAPLPQAAPARTRSRWRAWWSAACARAGPWTSRRWWCWRVRCCGAWGRRHGATAPAAGRARLRAGRTLRRACVCRQRRAPARPPALNHPHAGRKVWHLRVDIHVLDHQGALADACGLAALAALMAFRRPDVTVGGGDDGQVRAQPSKHWGAGRTRPRACTRGLAAAAPAAAAAAAAAACVASGCSPLHHSTLPPPSQAITVHPPEAREPVPLSIHHLPLPVTFALFEARGRRGGAPWWRG